LITATNRTSPSLSLRALTLLDPRGMAGEAVRRSVAGPREVEKAVGHRRGRRYKRSRAGIIRALRPGKNDLRIVSCAARLLILSLLFCL